VLEGVRVILGACGPVVTRVMSEEYAGGCEGKDGEEARKTGIEVPLPLPLIQECRNCSRLVR
jgi:hypothetical protein